MFKTRDDLILKAKELGFQLPFSDDLTPLLNPLELEGFLIPNRFVVQPMEGSVTCLRQLTGSELKSRISWLPRG